MYYCIICVEHWLIVGKCKIGHHWIMYIYKVYMYLYLKYIPEYAHIRSLDSFHQNYVTNKNSVASWKRKSVSASCRCYTVYCLNCRHTYPKYCGTNYDLLHNKIADIHRLRICKQKKAIYTFFHSELLIYYLP